MTSHKLVGVFLFRCIFETFVHTHTHLYTNTRWILLFRLLERNGLKITGRDRANGFRGF
jgi:hypothetical protein